VVPGEIQRRTGGSYYDRMLAESLTEQGFEIDLVSVPDLPYFAGLLTGLVVSPRLLFRLSRHKYEVVIEDAWAHSTTLLFNLICRIIVRIPLVVIVHQVRSRAMKPPASSIVRIAETLTLRSARLIVTVSRFISAEVEHLLGGKAEILVAPPGSAPLSGPCRERGESERLRLLFVGNCTRLKGLDYLIEALGMLRDLPLELDVVGDVTVEPHYYRRLVHLARAVGVSERVTFHGTVEWDDLGTFYSRADIFAFPSLYEGFGIVLAEAMHAGLPIVTTRTGPIGEIVHEGGNALIVPIANSRAFANALRLLASDPEMRREFGRRSSERAGELPTWKQTCNSIGHQVEIMSRTTRDKNQSMKTTPTQ
jgi:glycosyltransferase involved in cell wall biosynthesis